MQTTHKAELEKLQNTYHSSDELKELEAEHQAELAQMQAEHKESWTTWEALRRGVPPARLKQSARVAAARRAAHLEESEAALREQQRNTSYRHGALAGLAAGPRLRRARGEAGSPPAR